MVIYVYVNRWAARAEKFGMCRAAARRNYFLPDVAPQKGAQKNAADGALCRPAQPWRCLWLLFLEQMTITLPFLLIILHLSHIGFTEGLTFMISPFIHEKSFCCAKIFFREIFIVVKRLNGRTKFALAVFRRHFFRTNFIRLPRGNNVPKSLNSKLYRSEQNAAREENLRELT